jgi:hypothetical protein
MSEGIIPLVVMSSHDYPLTSSAPNSTCRLAHNNLPKTLGKPFYKSASQVSVASPEATWKLSHAGASTQRQCANYVAQ